MKITIEIDVQPDELRRFLGLPDIVGLQEDIIAYMKEKAAAAADLSPTDFVRQNLDSFGVTSTLRKFVHGARKATGLGDDDEDEDPGAAPPRRRRRATGVADDEGLSPATPAPGGPDAGETPLRSYDESSQAAPGPAAGETDEAPDEADRGATAPSALDAAEEIGAALAAVPRRALRSLRARAPSFGFNLDAARERRARARAEAHEAESTDDAETTVPDEAAPGTASGDAPARTRRAAAATPARPASDPPASPDPDDVF